MWERIREAGRTAWMVVGILVLVGIIGWIILYFRVIIPPLLLGGAIVFVLNPIVTWLQRRGLPRVVGTVLSYLLLLALLTAVVGLIIPVAFTSDDLGDEFTRLGDDLERWWDEQAEASVDNDWLVELPTWEELGNDLREGSEQGVGESLSTVRDVVGSVLETLLIAILAPILAFYVLVDLPRIGAITESLIPHGAKEETYVLGQRLNRAVGGFFRGQLIVAFIVGVMSSFGLWLIGLPFWLIVGMLAGLFNIVPLIGPWIGGALGVVVAFAAGDGFEQAVWVAIVMVIAQQIDNHFISPMVMQRTVRIHPAVVILALLAGGTLFGFLGLFLAVPATAVVKILASHFWRTYVLGQSPAEIAAIWDEQDSEPGVGLVERVGDQESAVMTPSQAVRYAATGEADDDREGSG